MKSNPKISKLLFLRCGSILRADALIASVAISRILGYILLKKLKEGSCFDI